jgi:low temperature requirement protein LtrA
MSTETTTARPRRLSTALREVETVTPLELFFDLVFVLAFTQCTALMADDPTWSGLAKGLLVLGVLWWSWVGYAWLTSVVDPEEDAVRLVIFAAMAALLIVGLCVPEAFGDTALILACAYAVVRLAHIALFMLAWRSRPRSPAGCSSAPRSPTARCRARCGRSRSGSTSPGPTSSGRRGGSSSRTTSPSATG